MKANIRVLFNRELDVLSMYVAYCYTAGTVKPSVFACPLFHEPNKTAKLKGANTDAIPTLISIGVENLRLAHR